MSRWLWPWSNCVKERVCRYLLHHYLGHFFQEHLSLDQLSLDLYKGSVALRDIHLEIWVRSQARAREGGGGHRAAATRGSRRRGRAEGPSTGRVEVVEVRPFSGVRGTRLIASRAGRGSLRPLLGRRD